MTARPRERFALVVEDAGDAGDPSVIIRLRLFLKRALRAYGLRCVEARPARPAGPASPPPPSPGQKGADP